MCTDKACYVMNARSFLSQRMSLSPHNFLYLRYLAKRTYLLDTLYQLENISTYSITNTRALYSLITVILFAIHDSRAYFASQYTRGYKIQYTKILVGSSRALSLKLNCCIPDKQCWKQGPRRQEPLWLLATANPKFEIV